MKETRCYYCHSTVQIPEVPEVYLERGGNQDKYVVCAVAKPSKWMRINCYSDQLSIIMRKLQSDEFIYIDVHEFHERVYNGPPGGSPRYELLPGYFETLEET